MEKTQTVIMTVGLPGSGKTTWANRYAKEHGFTVYSSDRERERIYGDESIVGDSDTVFRELYADVDRGISQGLNVIIDSTGLSVKSRCVIADYHERGLHTVAVVIDTPLETCLRRNSRRERNVPEDVIRRMNTYRTEPSVEEGFDEIVHVNGVVR